MDVELKKLHLMAMDEADLDIISAAAQDALFLPKDIFYSKKTRRFAVSLHRFCHEFKDGKNLRVMALLSFDGVLDVKVKNVLPQGNIPKAILNIKFIKDEVPPSGTIIIELAENAQIALKVECLDIILGDIGEIREVRKAPNHKIG